MPTLELSLSTYPLFTRADARKSANRRLDGYPEALIAETDALSHLRNHYMEQDRVYAAHLKRSIRDLIEA